MNIRFNKKLLALLVAGTMTISPLGFKNKAKAETVFYIQANTDVNVRKDSNIDSKRLTTLKEGDTLMTLGYLENGWYQVLYEGGIAYVCGDYVSCYSKEVEDHPQVIKATEQVRVRKEPTTESEKLGSIDKGEVLEYIETAPNGWYKVIYKGEEAYVCNDYATIEKEEIHSELVQVVTANKEVNIRSEANTDCRKLGTLEKGESLICYGQLDNGWYQVKYNGAVGYVSGKYVTPDYKQMITNDVTGLVSMKEDSYIYEDRAMTIPIGTIPQYELGRVYNIGDNYYLISSEAGTGYIPKRSAEKLGDVVVVVDVSSQVMTLYKEALPALHGAVVTGKPSTPSDIGLFKMYSKSRDKNLNGLESNHVDFWMPYNGGEGLHDAKWQKEFGGERYKKHGSHGCINMPRDLAEDLYGEVSKGTQVLVKR